MVSLHKFWIYDVIIKISSITFLFTLILFFFYFVSSSQGLTIDSAYGLIHIISISAISSIIITIFKIIVNIVKKQSVLRRIKGIANSVIMLIISIVLFVVINSIYLLSIG